MSQVPISALINRKATRLEVTPKAEWRTVEVTGTWNVADQVLVRKQSLESELGLWVITPLVLSDRTIVLVNRGWVAAANSAIDSPTVSTPPPGTVRLLGRVRLVKPRLKTRPTDLPANQVDQLIPREIITKTTVLDNAYLEMTSSAPEALTAGLSELPAPEVTEGPHRSYALQWIFFAIMTVIGWGVLLRSDYLALRDQAESEELSPSEN